MTDDAAVERAAEALCREADGWWPGMAEDVREKWRERARIALAAAAASGPTWPTDETMNALITALDGADHDGCARSAVGRILVEFDPIISAAVEIAAAGGMAREGYVRALIDAVRGAQVG